MHKISVLTINNEFPDVRSGTGYFLNYVKLQKAAEAQPEMFNSKHDF